MAFQNKQINKIGALLSVKDPVPSGLCSQVIYNFRVQAVTPVMSERCADILPFVWEHLTTDRALHIFKHLESSLNVSHCVRLTLKILDNASMPFQLKIKEAIYIKLEKPSLVSL